MYIYLIYIYMYILYIYIYLIIYISQPASQQASYPTLVRDCEGDTLVDLEGDMQSALFLMHIYIYIYYI